MPDTKRPLKVFLCHAHDDHVAVRALYKRLIKDGVDAWLDKEKLHGGSNWEYEIRKAVRESDVVVVCLSKQFTQDGFRQKEVQIALDEAALKPKEEIFIIPVRLEECDVPERLAIWHWLDLFRRGGYLKLMESLEARALELRRATVELPKPDETNPNLPGELKPEQTNNIFVTVDGNVQGNVIIGNENAVQTSRDKSIEPSNKKAVQIHWAATDALQDGKPYISIDITSEENRLIKCYCYIKSLELNGTPRDDLKQDIVKNTTRVSWSGGDDGVGIKNIDPIGFGKINLASLDSKGIRKSLQFETAKGPQSKDRDESPLPLGNYTIVLGLSCAADEIAFTEIPIIISFEYAEEHQLGGDNRINWRETYRVLRLLPKGKSLSPQTENLDKSREPVSLLPKEEKESEKPTRKLKTEYIIAIIGAIATIIAALIGIFPQLFKPAPGPRVTAPFIPTLTATLTISHPSETPEPSLIPTETLTLMPSSLPTEITDAKGVSMRLVPAGDFMMGNNAKDSFNESPAHKVYLDTYYIDKYEVTNSLYKTCVDTGLCKPPISSHSHTHLNYYGNTGFDNYPVIYVDWDMAKNYCESRGAELPTEAEWEKAARGPNANIYPWGNTPVWYQTDCTYGNFATSASVKGECVGDTSRVGSYEKDKSYYGLYDMAGNVAELVSDYWQSDYYTTLGEYTLNPKGPLNGNSHVVRGWWWSSNFMSSFLDIRLSVRMGFFNKEFDKIGFRCARSAP